MLSQGVTAQIRLKPGKDVVLVDTVWTKKAIKLSNTNKREHNGGWSGWSVLVSVSMEFYNQYSL